MQTNIEVDEELIQHAMLRSGATTRCAVVESALRLLVRLQDQDEAVRSLRGKVQWEGNLEESRLSRFEL